MSNLVIVSLVVNVLLFIVLAYLFVLRLVDKGVIDNLAGKIKVREAEIKSLNNYIDGKIKRSKLYTFHSAGFDQIENVVNWGEYNQRLKLTLDDGSFYIFNVPSEYRLIKQTQPEKEPSV